ncbi:glycoside hydrolase family 97 protein [candidate division KSB1 bacterium]
MKILKQLCFGVVLCSFFVQCSSDVPPAREFELSSPDGSIRITVSHSDKVYYSVFFHSEEIIRHSPVSMTVRDIGVLGEYPEIIESNRRTVNEEVRPVVPVKSKVISDNFNEIAFTYAGNFGLDFRTYNEGFAYRFRTGFDREIIIESEEVEFAFTDNHNLYYPAEESFLTHSERLYEYIPVNSISADKMSCLPVLVDIEGGPKIAITEASLRDYPGMYLRGDNTTSLYGLFPAAARREEQARDRTVRVVEREQFIAKTQGTRTYPWRLAVITDDDAGLIENQMVYLLSEPNRLEDVSWIRPGKVAWDWWNALNLYGVDFNAGINTETYKYYIDFASQYGIEYIILDEGWSDTRDLFEVDPEINMAELLHYAEEKNVGIILWVVWKTLDDQLDVALDQFQEWGVKGIKVDFMQRDDQWMVNYYWRIAEAAAQRHLLVDFHGSYKPAGLRRTYPNVLTREGVQGLEHSKWNEQPDPEHNLTIPFIRMLAGPMDYTPGAMINAQMDNFNADYTRPMSLGTRCHQLAMYVVFESPLQMLADSPSNYLREKECMEFLSAVPSVWDETVVLEAAVSDYVVIARKSENEWFMGAMTDWTPREFTVHFSFLGPGNYTIVMYEDGINAGRNANDYKKTVRSISQNDELDIRLAQGGGWAARIY